MVLSKEERERYSRQMMMEGWGEEAQQRLKRATVFIAGAGGLGSPVAIYLAVAGVGHLRVCDFDSPDLSNLNRQILHDETRIGVNKAISAKMSLERVNPNIRITAITERIEADNVDRLVGDSDIIVDCMDNFPTRFVLNESAIRKRIPLVHGCIWGIDGRISFIQPPQTPCLRCIVAEPPPKEVFPVVGATPGVIGCLQALEVLKFLCGSGENLKGKLLLWEGGSMTFRTFRIPKDPDCPVCRGLDGR